MNKVQQYLALAAEYDQTTDPALWTKMAGLLEKMKGKELTEVAKGRKAAHGAQPEVNDAVNTAITEEAAMTENERTEIEEGVQAEVSGKPKAKPKKAPPSKAKQSVADAKKRASDKKAERLAALKARKKDKPKAPPKDYGWTKHPDAGSVCYVPSGKAVLVSLSKDKAHVQVRSEADETIHIHKASVVRWKAFNEDLRDRYTKDASGTRTLSGSVSVSIGDEVAKALNGLSVEQLANVAETAKAEERFKGWSSLNPGMQRMNLGNVLRGMLRSEAPESVKPAKAAIVQAAKMPRLYEPKTKTPAKKAAPAKKSAKAKAA